MKKYHFFPARREDHTEAVPQIRDGICATVNGEKTRDIRIIYNFVGEIPNA